MSDTFKDRIIDTLINKFSISSESIDDVLIDQKNKSVSFGQALTDRNLISEEDFLSILVDEMGIPFINLKKFKIDLSLQNIVPERIARQYGVVPISELDYALTVALSDPMNIMIVDDLKLITGKDIDVVISTESDIKETIEKFYGEQSASKVTEVSKDIQVDDFEIVSDTDMQGVDDAAVDESEKAPIIRMVNLVIKEALKKRASDIHIEPEDTSVRVRYRVDGVLQDILKVPKESQNAIVVRIKIMSNIDITATQIPQDGRFKLKVANKEVDFRVSLLPTTFGQKIVMRVLDKVNLSVGLEGLGFEPKAMEVLQRAIKKPFGMILVTGPTGSGKSTTLYSVISELNTVDKNIITVEDPVEYLIEGLTQIHARPEIGFTFAEGLRSILRQSPDVVMVGEIRDNETADIAIKASLTGQLVFSTLHTNDAAGALTRLVDMGVYPFPFCHVHNFLFHLKKHHQATLPLCHHRLLKLQISPFFLNSLCHDKLRILFLYRKQHLI